MTTLQMELLQDIDADRMTDNLKQAVLALREGKIVLLLDAHERENEGDLIVAAEKVTPASVNFLIKKGSGIVCLALPKQHLDHLGLPPMIPDNTNFYETAFTVSMEARLGITTGVSAKDRTHSILTAMADDAQRHHLARPGHVFPLAAQKNGVFDRMGHTEGSTDLMKIAGLKPGAALCELMNDDGSMMIGEDRTQFAIKHSLPVVSIEEILFHRCRQENIFEKISETVRGTRFGELLRHSFRFFDGMMVEVLEKNIAKKSPTRLSLISGDLLEQRFMNHMLYETAHDPLALALRDLEHEKTDMVIVGPSKSLGLKNSCAQELRQNAFICRVLVELSVLDIVSGSHSLDLLRIARHYFSIDVV